MEIGPRFLPPLALLVLGRSPAEALARVHALFALCRHGQCLALSKAVAQALDVPATPEWARLLRALRDLEMLREHSLNLLRLPGWPAPEPSLPPRLLKALAGLAAALSGGGSTVFVPDGTSITLDRASLTRHSQELGAALEGLLGSDWLDGPHDFDGTLRNGRSPYARFLAALGPDADVGRDVTSGHLPARLPEPELSAIFRDPTAASFAASPVWHAQPRETGCYSRFHRRTHLAAARELYGHGVASRIFARLAEMRVLAQGLRRRLDFLMNRSVVEKPAPRRSDGFGLGQVQTARGLLIHAVSLRDGTIADCRYVAPTEWNFHPQGLVPAALTGLPADDEQSLFRRVGLFLQAIDPCVEFQLHLSHSHP